MVENILFYFFAIYGTLKQKPKDEIHKSQRPHIIAEHKWYKKENNDTNGTKLIVIVIINIRCKKTEEKEEYSNSILNHKNLFN